MKTDTEEQILAIARRPRYQRLSHPWNRGFPNNKRVQEAKESLCAMCEDQPSTTTTGSGIKLCSKCLKEWAE